MIARFITWLTGRTVAQSPNTINGQYGSAILLYPSNTKTISHEQQAAIDLYDSFAISYILNYIDRPLFSHMPSSKGGR